MNEAALPRREHAIASFHELPPKQLVWTMVGVLSASFMAALDQTIVGTAMPRVIAELHGFEHYSGVVTAYMIASTAVVPIAGKLSDLYGRKRFLIAGVVLFGVASVLCGNAESMLQLIAWRGLQGVGAGLVTAMAFTTIADLFPPAKRGRVSGMMGAVFGVASVVGPAVGGFLTDGPGWRWVFYVNIPFGLLSATIIWFSFPHVVTSHHKRPSIDYAGALTLLAAVIPLLLALSWGGRDYAWDSPVTLSLIGGGLSAIGIFLFVERRAREPILPLQLFQNDVVATSSTAVTLVAAGMFGTTLFIPLFIQTVIGSSATKSGAVMTPLMLAMICSSMTSGQLMTRLGRYRAIAIFGVSTTALGLFLLSLMDVDTTYGTVVRNMVIMGLGLGATMPVFSLSVQNAVDPKFVGTATSTIQFFRSMGGSLGAAVFGSVLVNRYSPAFHAALPPEAARLPAPLMNPLENPQALMNPELAAQLKAGFAALGPDGARLLESVEGATRVALAHSIHVVYLCAAIVLAIASVITFRLRDIPLRKTNRSAPSEPAARDPGLIEP